MMYNDNLTPKLIWNIAQNKPSLIADDLEQIGIPRSITYSILLARGVFKWLAVRRDLIRLKNVWRDELSVLYQQQREYRTDKNWTAYYEAKGRIKAIEMCRAQVRQLCHSERWRAPDFDREANKFLEAIQNDGE